MKNHNFTPRRGVLIYFIKPPLRGSVLLMVAHPMLTPGVTYYVTAPRFFIATIYIFYQMHGISIYIFMICPKGAFL
jgi:hypothetical protein